MNLKDLAINNRDNEGRVALRHGLSHTPEHRAWIAMRQRCNDPNYHAYADYGGRGIRVCERWDSFELFLEDVGHKPSPDLSLDRFPNNDGNYEPGNVRWATPVEQSQNRRSNKLDDWDAKFIRLWRSLGYPQLEVARAFNINQSTVSRIAAGKRRSPAPAGA